MTPFRHALAVAVTLALPSAALAQEEPPVETEEEAEEEAPPPPEEPPPPPIEAPPEPPAQPPPPPEEEPAVPDVVLQFSPGEGLDIASADDQFSLRISARVMILGQLEFPIEEIPDDVDDANDVADLTFSLRRARINFSGYAFGEHNRYRIQLALSPADMRVDPDTGMPRQTPLLDYYLEFRHLRDLHFRIGQYVLQFNRSRVISSSSLGMVDRSIVNGEQNLDRDLGVMFFSRDFLGAGWFRYYLGLSTGEGRDGGFGPDFGMVYLARFEVLPLGPIDTDYAESDLARTPEPRLSIGAAYAFLDDAGTELGVIGNAPADGGTTDIHTWTADAMFKWRGLAIQLEMVGRYGLRNPGDAVDEMGNPIPAAPARNGIGGFLQIGYLLPPVDVELLLRGAINIAFDDESEYAENREIGFGVSWYFYNRHAYKLQFDFVHVWDRGGFEEGTPRLRVLLQATL